LNLYKSHSYYSDGELSPEELVRLAKESGVKYLSLTDHNSVNGVEEAIKEAELAMKYDGILFIVVHLILLFSVFEPTTATIDVNSYRLRRFNLINYVDELVNTLGFGPEIEISDSS